jgi:hypothetical protein
VRTAINSIYAELVGTGTTEPTPKQPVTLPSNVTGREADHGVFNHARTSTMEAEEWFRKRGKKICIAIARESFAICGQTVWREIV